MSPGVFLGPPITTRTLGIAAAGQMRPSYEPFGKTTASGLTTSSTLQYTGRENAGTGLYYYRARYYHPVLQRFISEDPIEFAGGDVNFYAYVGGNPINDRDPTGEIAPLAALALPFAIPAFVKVGAFIGSAVAAG